MRYRRLHPMDRQDWENTVIRVVRISAVAAGAVWLALAASGTSFAQSHHRSLDSVWEPFSMDVSGDTDVSVGSVVNCSRAARICLNGAYQSGNVKDTGNVYING